MRRTARSTLRPCRDVGTCSTPANSHRGLANSHLNPESQGLTNLGNVFYCDHSAISRISTSNIAEKLTGCSPWLLSETADLVNGTSHSTRSRSHFLIMLSVVARADQLLSTSAFVRKIRHKKISVDVSSTIEKLRNFLFLPATWFCSLGSFDSCCRNSGIFETKQRVFR